MFCIFEHGALDIILNNGKLVHQAGPNEQYGPPVLNRVEAHPAKPFMCTTCASGHQRTTRSPC
jgi:hypothetical protein